MNYGTHTARVLSRRQRWLEDHIDVLEKQRDLLTDALHVIYRQHADPIAFDAMRLSARLEDEYTQRHMLELEGAAL